MHAVRLDILAAIGFVDQGSGKFGQVMHRLLGYSLCTVHLGRQLVG